MAFVRTRIEAALAGYDAMLELVGALAIGLLTWLGIARLLAGGAFLGRQRPQRAERERNTKSRPKEYLRGMQGGQDAERRRQAQPQHAEQWRGQPEQGHETPRQRQHQRERVESEENEWWSILEVSPDAGADEIRRSYLGKIQQSHPDRLVGLTPELLELAEQRTKTLNAAYTEAKRARRGSSDWFA
jgi:DnaJ-domain-containing protein 1